MSESNIYTNSNTITKYKTFLSGCGTCVLLESIKVDILERFDYEFQ